jgi:hypothetical protein
VIALRGLGGGIKRKFVLLQLDRFQVKVEIVDVGVLKPIKLGVGPKVLSFSKKERLCYFVLYDIQVPLVEGKQNTYVQ